MKKGYAFSLMGVFAYISRILLFLYKKHKKHKVKSHGPATMIISCCHNEKWYQHNCP